MSNRKRSAAGEAPAATTAPADNVAGDLAVSIDTGEAGVVVAGAQETPPADSAPGEQIAGDAFVQASDQMIGVASEVYAAPLPPVAPPVSMPIETLIAERARMDAGLAEQMAIVVTGPRDGRRRAGRAFGVDPVRLPLMEPSDEDLRAIDGDPLLSWSVVQIPAAEPLG